MHLSDLPKILLRRWYVTLLGLALTAGLVFVVADRVHPTYESTASVVLLPGRGIIVEGGNPFLYLGGLTQARDVLVRSLGSDELHEEIVAGRSGISYTILADATTSGPMMVIAVTGPSPASVQSVRTKILSVIPKRLTELQKEARAPATARITVLTLTADQRTTVLQKARLRAVLAVGGLGVVLSMLMAGLVDGLLLAMQLRRTGARRGPRTAAPHPPITVADPHTLPEPDPERPQQAAPERDSQPAAPRTTQGASRGLASSRSARRTDVADLQVPSDRVLPQSRSASLP